MQSQGSTSSQPSFDSLSLSDSLLFSDSEQAEDDADVFLTDSSSSVNIGGGGGAAANGDRGSESPGSQWTCDEEEEESDRSESGSKATHNSLDKKEPTSQIPKSQGDLLFAQKCAELQGFLRPMLELLNGLKRGRFDRGLSSFQQSVAMDRIQRIVGVLQRPNSGEKYLNTLLQVEIMLKLWFPQIHTQVVSAASSVATSPAASPATSLHHTSRSTPPHKHKDQLHIPVKKRRLSWTGTDSPTPSPGLLHCPRRSAEEKRVKADCMERDGTPSPSSALDANRKSAGVSDSEDRSEQSKYKAGQSSEPSLTWVHVAPILSPRKACHSHESTAGAVSGEKQPVAPLLPLRRRRSPETQDSSISSTTHYKHAQHGKKPLRCQSQPTAGQQSDNAETCPGPDQAPPAPPAPLPEASPAPPRRPDALNEQRAGSVAHLQPRA